MSEIADVHYPSIESETASDVASAAEAAIVDLSVLDDDVLPDDLSELVDPSVEHMTYDEFDFASIVGTLDLRDVTGSLAVLEAYRAPFVRAARRAGRKNPSAEFYNVANTPLFNRRIALRKELESLRAKKRLTDANEVEMIWAEGELETLTELIVRLNYGMTRKYVKQFTSNTSMEDSADFQGAANVGLMVAIDKFDPALGKFGSWAYKPIQRAVLKAVRDADFKNLNEGDFEKRPKVLKAYNELMESRAEGAPTPTYEEVAALAGVHHDLARRVLAAPYLDSIHTVVGDEGGSELGDLIPDEGAAFEEAIITEHGIAALMQYGMSELDPREHYVLVRVFGLDGEAPDALADIGNQLKLSREAVRQIRGKAMSKLLHPATLRKLVRGGRD